MMNTLDTQLELQNFATDKDARLINKLISDENKLNWDHMLLNSPEIIQKHIDIYGWFVLKTLWDFVWTIKLEKVEKDGLILYEKWWLIVRNEYRNEWYARFLQKCLHHFYDHQPIYSVTNVETVKNMNLDLWNIEFTKNEISNEILSIIEIPGTLLDDDVIFFNKTAINLYDIKK